jgi:hypothetical protein
MRSNQDPFFPFWASIFSIAKWMKDMDAHGFLDRFFNPPLSTEEKKTAKLEGWILGVY